MGKKQRKKREARELQDLQDLQNVETFNARLKAVRREYGAKASPTCGFCGGTGIRGLYYPPGSDDPKVTVCRCTQ